MKYFANGIELPEGYGDWILRWRIPVLCVIGLVTVLATVAVVRIGIQRTLLEAYVDDPSEFIRYRNRVESLGGDSDDLIFAATIEGDSLFTAETMNAIRNAARQLEELPEIERVNTLPDALWARPAERLSAGQIIGRRLLRGKISKGEFNPTEDRLPLQRVWPASPRRQAKTDLKAIQNTLLQDNAQGAGLLISKNGTAHTMVLKLVSAGDLSPQDQIKLTRTISETLRQHGLGAGGIHVVGLTISQGWMFREVERAFFVFFPIGLLIICTLVYVLFQRLTVVTLTAVIGLIATAWGVGFAAVVIGKLGILVAAAPLVIFVISTSDVVHLTTAYKLELAAGLPADKAIRKMVHEVGSACVLTSVTTFVGFLALMAVPAPMTRHLALAVAIGVASALLLALTIVPIAYSFMRPLPITDTGKVDRVINRLVESFIKMCRQVSLGHPKAVIASCALLLAAAFVGLSQIHVDADFPRRFPEDHPLHAGVNFFNEQFTGTVNVEIFVQANSGSVLEPHILRALAALETRLAELPEVRQVFSLSDLYQAADATFRFDPADNFPNDAQTAQHWLDVFEDIDGDRIHSLINADQDVTRITVRLQPSGYVEVSEIAKRIDSIAQEELPSDVTVETSGSFPIIGSVIRMIARSQLYGLILCFISVSLIMAIGIGSLRNALLAQIPNILPAALLLGFLAVTLVTVDADMLGIPTVALGIAVDDTIHFLHRYKLQKSKAGDRVAALDQTFPYTGRAILQTTLILCLGFLPFALSSFLSVWMLGTYLVFTLLCAVLGDLILLPAMIKVGIIR